MLMLAVIVPFPTIALSFILKETNQWASLGLIWIVYLEYGVLGVVISQFATNNVLSSLGNNIVDKIESINDLENFRQIISYSLENTKLSTFCNFIHYFLGNIFFIGKLYIHKRIYRARTVCWNNCIWLNN